MAKKNKASNRSRAKRQAKRAEKRAKKTGTAKKPIPLWKLKEQLVAFLERHYDQTANVRVDVDLPVLDANPPRTRQCDVVVDTGAAPRVTRAIVEVQKRKAKPSINDFEGWVVKMRQVGAQHLYCVSEAGFPKSILQRAAQLGPTVRLINFAKVKDGSEPLPSTIASPELQMVTYDQLRGAQFEFIHLVRVDPKRDQSAPPDPHAKILRLGEHEISLTDIIDRHLFEKPANLEALPRAGSFSLRIDLSASGHLLAKTHDDQWIALKRLSVLVDLTTTVAPIQWEDARYEQLGAGTLAWALSGKCTLHGETIEVVAPLRQVSPGCFTIGRPMAISDHDLFFAIDSQGYRVAKFQQE